MQLELEKFIAKHKNWKKLLVQEPYNLRITEAEGLIIIKYIMGLSDFNNPIVRECRGIILDESDNSIVSQRFNKFGNYGEAYVPEIDWTTARVQEKVDGSLVSLFYWHDCWHVATNGTVNAYTCDLPEDIYNLTSCPYKTFGDLFDEAVRRCGLDYSKLDTDYTYIFELVSPYNKVVVSYPDIEIYHIGARNNVTHEEADLDIGVKKPRSNSLHTLQECIDAANIMGYNEEGFVVVDGKWNRLKIKSPLYVAAHYLKNNNEPNLEDIVDLVLKGEEGEFLTYFPEYGALVGIIKVTLKEKGEQMQQQLRALKKIYAEEVSKIVDLPQDYFFECYNSPVYRVEPMEYFANVGAAKTIKMFNLNNIIKENFNEQTTKKAVQ